MRNLQGEIYKKAEKYFAEFRRHPAAAQLRGLPVWPARPEDEPKRNLKYGDFVHFTFKVKSYILFLYLYFGNFLERRSMPAA